jgi:D-alanyl-D-alanine carboxypeptidase
LAIDLASGSVLFTQNPALPLAPASNEKLPLTYAALSNLGASYRIETDVLGEGAQDGAIFDGALVLKGGGDPTLSTAGLRALAAQLRAAGIRHVTGGIVADESYFDARRTVAGWKPSFYIQESPPLSALVVDRARVGRYTTRRRLSARRSAGRESSSTERCRSVKSMTSRSRWRRSTRRRSRRSSASWTRRATTSLRSCCSSSSAPSCSTAARVRPVRRS